MLKVIPKSDDLLLVFSRSRALLWPNASKWLAPRQGRPTRDLSKRRLFSMVDSISVGFL